MRITGYRKDEESIACSVEALWPRVVSLKDLSCLWHGMVGVFAFNWLVYLYDVPVRFVRVHSDGARANL
jgi:hypothetical protein